MDAPRTSRWMVCGSGLVVAALLGGCGGGGSGSGTATVSGNVSSASTTALERPRASWLARLRDEVIGLAREAYAAAANTSLAGIKVTVTGVGSNVGSASDATDAQGVFNVNDAPSGDVTVFFGRGNCSASVPLSDVEDTSAIKLDSTTIACDSATPQKIEETFVGVLENAPASQNGNLNVCAFGGGRNHVRTVSTSSTTTFQSSDGSTTTFSEFREGDRISVSGARRGAGSNSSVDATLLRRVSAGNADRCSALPVPTSTPHYGASLNAPPTRSFALLASLGAFALVVPRRKRR